MEWVETTGRTVEEAKEAALDELGVDDADAEFDVLTEPRVGLFGRLRSEARVRARVRPTAPRAKDDRRDRRRRRRDQPTASPGEGSPAAPSSVAPSPSAQSSTTPPTTATAQAVQPSGEAASVADNGAPRAAGVPRDTAAPAGPKRNRRRRRTSTSARVGLSGPDATGDSAMNESGGGRSSVVSSERAAMPSDRGGSARRQLRESEEGVKVDVDLETQAGVAKDFLTGLVREFDLSANVRVERPDDETVDLHVDGANLGLLIGQKGATLLALQDLTRTVVQRKTGATNGRLHVDVAGYRQKRAEALARFARQVAEEVRSAGAPKALEPMPAPDRKVVHDAVAEVPGVTSHSEGEDTQRRVVIAPEPA